MHWVSSPAYPVGIHSPIPSTLAGFRIITTPDYPLKTQILENLPIFQLQVSLENLTDSLVPIGGALLNPDNLLRTVIGTKEGNPVYSLIHSLVPYSAFGNDNIENTIAIQQIDKMGLLLFFYLISNSFPANARRDKMYQLVKSQRHFSPSIFRTLNGPSVDSLLENLFALAIEAGDLPMVKSLIKAGANVNANNCRFKRCPIPMTPLQLACIKNNTPLVQELLTAAPVLRKLVPIEARSEVASGRIHAGVASWVEM